MLPCTHFPSAHIDFSSQETLPSILMPNIPRELKNSCCAGKSKANEALSSGVLTISAILIL